jgi:pyruvate kinase
VREILNLHGSDAHIIAKIERVQALDNFKGILEASDGIMVARGDMGVEVPLAQVPIIQKKLISECNYSGKPVITATQMMESMLRSPVPTRAEVTDVANAIYDGTDAIMLSGETSIGQFPEEAVKFMSEVATTTEESLPYESIIVEKRQYLKPETDDAISYDACQTAYQLNASLIVAFTESGGTAGRVSKYRPKSSILALTYTSKVQRLLTLRWGVNPVIVREITNVDDFFSLGAEFAVKMNELKSGDLVVLVAGLPIGVQGGTNLLRVLNI